MIMMVMVMVMLLEWLLKLLLFCMRDFDHSCSSHQVFDDVDNEMLKEIMMMRTMMRTMS